MTFNKITFELTKMVEFYIKDIAEEIICGASFQMALEYHEADADYDELTKEQQKALRIAVYEKVVEILKKEDE